MNKILVICGQTATGKTALGLEIARKFNGEIVSADSRQVYKGMDIGTGKDIPAGAPFEENKLVAACGNKTYSLGTYTIEGIPVWLYDVVPPDEEFSVAHFQCIGRSVIDDILKRRKLPIVVGGTGLYIEALFENKDTYGIGPNQKLRQELSEKTVHELQDLLQDLSADAWNKLNESDRKNPRRLVRKIEIAQDRRDMGMKTRWKESKDVLLVGLRVSDRQALCARIDDRVEARVRQGIIAEISRLLSLGYSWDTPALTALGYRQWHAYFDAAGKKRDEQFSSAVERWKHDEHAYARRQLTWFKKNAAIQWFDAGDSHCTTQVARLVFQWYTQLKQ